MAEEHTEDPVAVDGDNEKSIRKAEAAAEKKAVMEHLSVSQLPTWEMSVNS